MSTKQPARHLTVRLLCSVLAAGILHARALEPASSNVDMLLSNRDLSVSPGSDFFQYATGTWFARNPIPAGETRWGIGRLVRKQPQQTLRGINDIAGSYSRHCEKRVIESC